MDKKVLLGMAFRGHDNTWAYECVKSLEKNTRYPFDLFLVQWDSHHGEEFRIFPPSYCQEIFYTPQGLSKNLNVILARAEIKEYDFVGLLNDDLLFPPVQPETCWLTELVRYLETHENVGIVSPTWLWTGGDIEQFNSAAWHLPPSENPGVQGPCMILPKRALDRFRQVYRYYFDERFTAQWEEVEFLWRMHSLGFSTRWLNHISLFHYGSKTLESTNHAWVTARYNEGKKLFHELTGAPVANEWTVSYGIYHYRGGDGEMKPWGLPAGP